MSEREALETQIEFINEPIYSTYPKTNVCTLKIPKHIKTCFGKPPKRLVENQNFSIPWKSRRHILLTFSSHLKKLCSILRFWLEKLNCRYFHSFHSWKTPQNNFSCQNFSVEIHLNEGHNAVITHLKCNPVNYEIPKSFP